MIVHLCDRCRAEINGAVFAHPPASYPELCATCWSNFQAWLTPCEGCGHFMDHHVGAACCYADGPESDLCGCDVFDPTLPPFDPMSGRQPVVGA